MSCCQIARQGNTSIKLGEGKLRSGGKENWNRLRSRRASGTGTGTGTPDMHWKQINKTKISFLVDPPGSGRTEGLDQIGRGPTNLSRSKTMQRDPNLWAVDRSSINQLTVDLTMLWCKYLFSRLDKLGATHCNESSNQLPAPKGTTVSDQQARVSPSHPAPF